MILPKAILFDLDDTLISFDGASERAWKKCCEQFVINEKVDFDSVTLLDTINKVKGWYWSDPVRHKIGRENMINARRQIVQYAFEKLGYLNRDKYIEFADGYSNLQNELVCLFEDTLETLEALKKLKIRMAVITNGTSKGQRDKLERFNLNNFFEFVLIDTEVGFSKPDVRIYELALEKLSLKADEVWMIGNNLVWDVEGAQKAGIYSIWNDYRQRGLPNSSEIVPDRIVSTIAELAMELGIN